MVTPTRAPGMSFSCPGLNLSQSRRLTDDCDDAYDRGNVVTAAIERDDALENRLGNGQEIPYAIGARRVIHHDVKLRREDEHSDPGQHSIHNGGRNSPEPASHAEQPAGHLHKTRADDDSPEQRKTELLA